jgi:hypothetical protein
VQRNGRLADRRLHDQVDPRRLPLDQSVLGHDDCRSQPSLAGARNQHGGRVEGIPDLESRPNRIVACPRRALHRGRLQRHLVQTESGGGIHEPGRHVPALCVDHFRVRGNPHVGPHGGDAVAFNQHGGVPNRRTFARVDDRTHDGGGA